MLVCIVFKLSSNRVPRHKSFKLSLKLTVLSGNLIYIAPNSYECLAELISCLDQSCLSKDAIKHFFGI